MAEAAAATLFAPAPGAVGSVIRFTVVGEAAPAGSKRIVAVYAGSGAARHPTGQTLVIDASKGSRPWKNLVAREARAAYSGPLIRGPIEITFVFYRPRPKGDLGKSGEPRLSANARPVARPDALKLSRGVEDSLSRVIYADDSQIVDEHLYKRFGEPARVEIEIKVLPATVGEARMLGEKIE